MAKDIAKKYGKEIFTLSLILVVSLAYWGIGKVQGASMTAEKDVLSDSRPSTLSNHTIYFTTASAWNTNSTFTITLNGGFTTPPTAPGDFDFSFGTNGTESDVGLSSATNTTNTWKVAVSNTLITFITGNTAGWVPANGNKCIVEIGKNAAGGSGQYTNPAKAAAPGTADTISIDLSYGPGTDIGKAIVAVIDGVTVTATVAESLSSSITIKGATECNTNFGTKSAVASSSNTSIGFGTVTPGTFYHACQDLAVATNAVNGYSMTSQENSMMSSGTSSIPDTNCDTTCTQVTGAAWIVTSNYGFGHGCKDITGTACIASYANTNIARQFADVTSNTEIPQAIMSYAGPANNTSQVEYRLNASPLQPPADYTNTIVYVVTPNF